MTAAQHLSATADFINRVAVVHHAPKTRHVPAQQISHARMNFTNRATVVRHAPITIKHVTITVLHAKVIHTKPIPSVKIAQQAQHVTAAQQLNVTADIINLATVVNHAVQL